ncbi:MAG TPA: phytanoyl-CoA dioxygenase family protein, partial [Verrucomicrobiales bacterium]|nr:phytanoyl-CoA dioxygenase family protein [Verrucomicrobiales bacterium]
SEGDLRARYYEEKKQTFEKGHSNQQKTRLSLIGHFQGKAAK